MLEVVVIGCICVRLVILYNSVCLKRRNHIVGKYYIDMRWRLVPNVYIGSSSIMMLFSLPGNQTS